MYTFSTDVLFYYVISLQVNHRQVIQMDKTTAITNSNYWNILHPQTISSVTSNLYYNMEKKQGLWAKSCNMFLLWMFLAMSPVKLLHKCIVLASECVFYKGKRGRCSFGMPKEKLAMVLPCTVLHECNTLVKNVLCTIWTFFKKKKKNQTNRNWTSF